MGSPPWFNSCLQKHIHCSERMADKQHRMLINLFESENFNSKIALPNKEFPCLSIRKPTLQW